MSNLNAAVYEAIEGENRGRKFGKGIYGGLEVIIMQGVGYANATNLCTKFNRRYFNWSSGKSTKERMAYFANIESESGSNLPIIIEVEGGNVLTRGTYLHPHLMLDLANWIGHDVYRKMSVIIINDSKREAQARVESLERALAEKNNILVEKEDKIATLLAALNAMRHEQRELITIVKDQSGEITDTRIIAERTKIQMDEVLEVNHTMSETVDELREQNVQIITKLDIAVETRVPPAAKPSSKESLALFALRTPVGIYSHYISCGQPNTIKGCIAKFGAPVFQIMSQPNSKNLFQRLKEAPGVMLYDGSKVHPSGTIDAFIQVIKDINDEKYVVNIPIPDPYRDVTVLELKAVCKQRKIKGYAKCNRADLIKLVKDNGGLPQPVPVQPVPAPVQPVPIA
jgi:hypothetical protein